MARILVIMVWMLNIMLGRMLILAGIPMILGLRMLVLVGVLI